MKGRGLEPEVTGTTGMTGVGRVLPIGLGAERGGLMAVGGRLTAVGGGLTATRGGGGDTAAARGIKRSVSSFRVRTDGCILLVDKGFIRRAYSGGQVVGMIEKKSSIRLMQHAITSFDI